MWKAAPGMLTPQRALSASLCGRSVLSDKSAYAPRPEADSWPAQADFRENICRRAGKFAYALRPVADLAHTGDETFPPAK